MKLQGFSIIFALIVLPIIIVISYYIQLQVRTISLQSSYDKKLLDATYDALSAFELNTANEDLSSVSDSLRTIIEASSNVFFNTLSTNLGMSNASKSYVEPYVPALLYTLYDGYYIYSPTQVPELLTDSTGKAVAVGDKGVNMVGTNRYTFTEPITDPADTNYSNPSYPGNKLLTYDEIASISDPTQYGQLLYQTNAGNYTPNINDADIKLSNKNILKTYIPYSARYKSSTTSNYTYNIVVTYSLDNFVTIEGEYIRGKGTNPQAMVNVTKSGYLLRAGSVTINPASTDEATGKVANLNNYSQEDAEKFIKAGNAVKVSIKGDGGTTTEIESPRISYSELNNQLTSNKNRMKLLDNLGLRQYSQINLENIDKFEPYSHVTRPNPETDESAFQTWVANEKKLTQAEINNCTYNLQLVNSVCYYVKGQIFTSWIQQEFVDNTPITVGSICDISTLDYSTIDEKLFSDETKKLDVLNLNFKSDELKNDKVFDTANPTTTTIARVQPDSEIPVDSPFYTHKLAVIRNSIQYNLNLAMSTYNKNTIKSQEYEMPVLSEDEWDQILTKVSIVSFMQGYKCGFKTYNNYKIASSVNNEITVDPDYIYYVHKDAFSDETTDYHKIDCSRLILMDTDLDIEKDNIDKQFNEIRNNPISNKEYISFSSKDVKYDKNNSPGDTAYYYDHKNLACYKCILDKNYKLFDLASEGADYNYNNIFDKDNTELYARAANLRKAYYIAVGNARTEQYKMNGFSNSEEFSTVYKKAIYKKGKTTLTAGDAGGVSDSLDTINNNSSATHIDQIKTLEITFNTIKATDSTEKTIAFKIYTTSDRTHPLSVDDQVFTLTTNTSNYQTITVNVDPDFPNGSSYWITRSGLFFDCSLNGVDYNSTIYYTDTANRVVERGSNDMVTYFNTVLGKDLVALKVTYK